MSEQSEINYLDGDIVWVKLGSCWWPGEVVGTEKLPPDVLPSFRKPPIAVVKFFQEDTYEYVKNLNSIFKYNCSRKNEFINKGLYMYRTKHGHMEKFPEDVIRAESAVGGDSAILTRDEFQEAKKESYASLFGDPAKKTTASLKKGKGGKGRPSDSSNLSTPMKKFKEKTNYKVHILLQGSKTPVQNNEAISTPSTNRAESEPSEVSPEKASEKNDNQSENEEAEKPPPSLLSTPTMSSSGMYVCHACQFSTQRLNVLILHNKTHSISYTPYTPSPIKKKPANKPKSTPVSSKSPKQRKRRTEKSDKKEKKSLSHKRAADEENMQEVKKPKTDEEIKSSLLADWDDGDEESADESSSMVVAGSPEVPIAAESPAVPTPAELPSAQLPVDSDRKPDSPTQKPESSSDSKYEFCEDEDWSTETDIGRKIPFKSSSKRSGDKKSLSIDEEEMVREVAELLIKTTLPELPSAPEPLKVEENFPERSIVKSPDKKHDKSQEKSSPEKKTLNDNQPTKTIFKTKTFFRSRHSRSQDAIGKYVAEQLNAAERLDMSESELNGSEVASSPEIRDSPPVEQVKVARLAPKIQFKKIKAEAAQQREIEKYKAEKQREESLSASQNDIITETPAPVDEKENSKMTISNISLSNTEKVYKNKRNASNDKDSVQKHKNQEVNENSIVKVNDDLKVNKTDDTSIEKNTIVGEEAAVVLKISDSDVPKSFEPFMNESTASAVDALLSVSREADRVTKVISDDPPEDLFEDDIKDNVPCNINGFTDTIPKPVEENPEKIIDSTEKSDDVKTVSDVDISEKLENNDPADDVQSDVTVVHTEDVSKTIETEENITEIVKPDEIIAESILPAAEKPLPVENIPSESDLQIAEALINLPTTTLNNKTSVKNKVKTIVKSDKIKSQGNNDLPVQSCQNFSIEEDLDITPTKPKVMVTPKKDINARFETEQEKSENLNAAKSLVQMSESIDHTIKISEMSSPKEKLKTSQLKDEEIKVSSTETEQSLTVCTNDFTNETVTHCISPNLHLNSPKLLKILEEPGLPKLAPRKTVTKQIIVPRKEKILNVDVGKSPIKPKTQSPKQKIIIRRTTPSKNLLNNIGEITTPDKIILSRTNKSSQDGSSVQTYTIQTTPDIPNTTDPNTIIIQQKIRQVVKPLSKLQKIKPQSQTVVTSAKESKITQNTKSKDDSIFDINSMPIVLTPESIEKMPIVMSDGNIITNSSNPPKLVKTKQTIVETEKVTAGPTKEIKPLIMSTSNEVSKVTTPNILSKSSKLRGTKPMLVIDKTTGKQKIIMTKTESHKDVKQAPTLVQSAPPSAQKAEKFIILPTQSSPRPGRTQKIVIHPQTGKAHVLVGKASETQLSAAENNKPVSAKLIPSASDSSTPGNTVMIITNAQGAQSRIVLTPEHEKILFPNKQQPTMSQLKPITHRITSGTGAVQKPIITTASGTATKTQTRIVPKQKSAIITSKGQLIVGGRIATTTQNIAPLPEIRPAPKRILASEPKKLVQTIQKNSSEPLIFLRQNSSAVMQLTVAQFEHLQRTGQIIQKAPTPVQENKIVVQKSVTITPKETVPPPLQKHRIRKQPNESPTPTKKLKHEIAIAPAPAPIAMPALTPIAPPQVQNVSSTTANISASNYADLENLEELLPSTAIVRQTEPTLVQSEVPQPPPAALSDGQLLAVPGEHFGGLTGSFYLCVEDNGNYTAIDNRPLILENNQLVPMPDPLPVLVPQPERRDILEAALANSDVFHGETAREDPPDFRDLNANVSVHCRVSETSTTLNQPIMTPIEVPSKVQDNEQPVPSNLEDGLAVIGVTSHTVPTSLELPITVTDPRIAPKTTDPLSNNNYGPPLLPSPNTELAFTTSEEDTEVSMGVPISMPILTDDDNVGKSMPILTDEVTERTVSSVESTIGSPSSIDVRESENEDSQWPRRLLTPCSDTSETSAEIPLQPVMQLSVNDLSHSS